MTKGPHACGKVAAHRKQNFRNFAPRKPQQFPPPCDSNIERGRKLAAKTRRSSTSSLHSRHSSRSIGDRCSIPFEVTRSVGVTAHKSVLLSRKKDDERKKLSEIAATTLFAPISRMACLLLPPAAPVFSRYSVLLYRSFLLVLKTFPQHRPLLRCGAVEPGRIEKWKSSRVAKAFSSTMRGEGRLPHWVVR